VCLAEKHTSRFLSAIDHATTFNESVSKSEDSAFIVEFLTRKTHLLNEQHQPSPSICSIPLAKLLLEIRFTELVVSQGHILVS
jgi:hypothetical protein